MVYRIGNADLELPNSKLQMIKDFRVGKVSWFGVLLKWDYEENNCCSVILLERTSDNSKSLIHYRGRIQMV